MCTAINFEYEIIETMGKLVGLVGKENIVINHVYAATPIEELLVPELCLCPVDVEATALKSGYVSRNGMLEEGNDWFMGYKWVKNNNVQTTG